MLVEDAPFELTDALKILQVVVVDDEIEDSGGLKEIGLARTLAGACPDPIDEIGLDTEQFGIDGDDETRFAVFDPPEDDSFGLM